MEDEKLESSALGGEIEPKVDVGAAIRDDSVGEERTLSSEIESACAGVHSQGFDSVVIDEGGGTIVMDASEQRDILEEIEGTDVVESIGMPLLSEHAEREDTDLEALEPEPKNKLEFQSGFGDAIGENAVSEEFPVSTDGTALHEEAGNTEKQEILDNERPVGDAGNDGDVDAVLTDDSTLIKDSEAVLGVSSACDEKVDHSVDLEMVSLQKSTSLYEENSHHENVITSDNNNNADSAELTEEVTCLITGNQQVHAHNFGGEMKCEAVCETSNTTRDEQQLEDEFLDSGMKSVDDEKSNTEEKELPLGNTNIESDSGMELDTLGSGMSERTQLEDAGKETDMDPDALRKGMLEEDAKMETETSSDVDEPGQSIPVSPAALPDDEDEAMTGDEEQEAHDTEVDTEADVESGKTATGKRKRGKISKTTPITKPTSKNSRKKIREDVCFICFEGGELVVCGRRGCPKAYHPSCVNRDEAFFRSKGRWNCGWHLCSICEKNAYYMCYTCAYSLCKSCIKDADAAIFCVRGNKGFCETCMRTVTLIEGDQPGSTDDEVDFDDRSSWEYLFKDYYTELKAKLSLSSSEIGEAKNQFNGAEISAGNVENNKHGDSGSEDSTVNKEPSKPKTRKAAKNSKTVTKEDISGRRVSYMYENADWASKELLEFVSHMKDGDISVLSQFDVQALLLEYIKRNKLRDPRRGSQIVCDARLKSLFGKPRVGHFEMLKLIESHFLLKDEQNDDVQSSVVDTENLQFDIDGNTDTMQKGMKDKKRKSRKKGDTHQSNLDEYAAVDMHNIGLIYLRRKLMEDLLEDVETFPDKVIGTFVRIRISGSNQKQDMYRLVQVVGTSKSLEPYKIGKKSTDIMVEILNLDKTESISIDTISNQDFTEEECKRLRQSIKCGLINPLTVGMILGKATELQVIRVNDLLESEILRISHLCDRASDLGRRKEHRECVEKLQQLKTPEERRRRLEELPEIHEDPKMDPTYESEDNDSDNENTQQDTFTRPISSDLSKRERGFISSAADTKESYYHGSHSSSRHSDSGRSMSRNIYTNSNAEMVHENTPSLGRNTSSLGRDRNTHQSDDLGRLSSATASEKSESDLRPRSGSVSAGTSLASGTSTSPRSVEKSLKINESEKMWHYLDPSGKVQGPFSMVQLRKWNNTGYFPANLKIWRATDRQENSLFLTDALAGKFPREWAFPEKSLSASNSVPQSHSLVDKSVRSFEASTNRDEDKAVNPIALSSFPNPSSDTLARNGTGAQIFAQGQSSVNQTADGSPHAGSFISASATNLQPSALAIPNLGFQSPTPAAVNSGTPVAAFTMPSSQPVIPNNSAVSLITQSITSGEPPEVQMTSQPVAAVQPVQNPTADNQTWATSGTPPVQPQTQGYNWGTPNVQNPAGTFQNVTPSGMQPDSWRPVQGSQGVPPSSTQNASWNMGPQENPAPTGVRPEGDNATWAPQPANTNMGWMNTAAGNSNMNWQQGGNQPAGWVAPPPAGNTGTNMQGFAPGTANPTWGAPPTPSWTNPSQAQVPGNAWVPPPVNSGAPPPVQGPPPNATQGWGPPPGNAPNQGWVPMPPPPGSAPNQGWGPPPSGAQGSWTDQRGGRPWNRQSSFGSGGGLGGSGRFKRDMVCPYNANGRCKKGARCDYLHV